MRIRLVITRIINAKNSVTLMTYAFISDVHKIQCKGEEQEKVFKVYKFQKSKWEQGIFCGRKQG